MILQSDARSLRAEPRRNERGIALAIVLVLVIVMVTAVYTFARHAVLNTTVTHNRLAAAEADALARGGLRIGETVAYLARLHENATAGSEGNPLAAAAVSATVGVDPWAALGDAVFDVGDDKTVRVSVEELSGRLNLNALVPQAAAEGDENADETNSSGTQSETEEAVEYLVVVLRHIIEGIDSPAEDKNYDERRIAQNLIDYMDADDTALDGRGENTYYLDQDPPYRARNGPFLSFSEIGLVEGVDRSLLMAMRSYMTVFPIGSTSGIDINRAKPWILPLLYTGTSGDRELVDPRTLRRLLSLRKEGKRVCSDPASDPINCVTASDAGFDEGSIYPESVLPAPVSAFRVVAEAQVNNLTRRMEAIYDVRPLTGPKLLSWRRLRGEDLP